MWQIQLHGWQFYLKSHQFRNPATTCTHHCFNVNQPRQTRPPKPTWKRHHFIHDFIETVSSIRIRRSLARSRQTPPNASHFYYLPVQLMGDWYMQILDHFPCMCRSRDTKWLHFQSFTEWVKRESQRI
jgi:hypothetical protein